MAHTDCATYQLAPGDAILVSQPLPGDAVWPAFSAASAQVAVVLDPPLLAVDPAWCDDIVQMGTLQTDLGPCRVSLSFRWLLVNVPEAQAA